MCNRSNGNQIAAAGCDPACSAGEQSFDLLFSYLSPCWCVCVVLLAHHLPFKTSQCAKHHRTSHCVLIPHWSAIFWIEHVWLVFLNLLLLILFEPLFSNGPFFPADKICLPKKWTLVQQLARQQLALAVQWGCKDYYDDIGKRQHFQRHFIEWFC